MRLLFHFWVRSHSCALVYAAGSPFSVGNGRGNRDNRPSTRRRPLESFLYTVAMRCNCTRICGARAYMHQFWGICFSRVDEYSRKQGTVLTRAQVNGNPVQVWSRVRRICMDSGDTFNVKDSTFPGHSFSGYYADPMDGINWVLSIYTKFEKQSKDYRQYFPRGVRERM